MSQFQFFVNGEWIEFDDFDLDWSLTHALRDRLGLTGTKISCGVGGCGACTVLVSKFDPQFDTVKHFTVNSCITPIFSVYGCHILTVEGIGSSDKKFVSPIQDALVRGNATQCGFCTPGFVMSVIGLQKQLKKDVNIADIKTALQGNLCRCTGYRPILEAVKCSISCSDCQQTCNKPSLDIEEQGSSQCKTRSYFPHLEDPRSIRDNSKTFFEIEKLLAEFNENNTKKKSLKFIAPNGTWFLPSSKRKLEELMKEYPDAKLVGGSTSNEIQSIPESMKSINLIDLSNIKELKVVQLEESSLKLGANLSLSEMEQEVQNIIKILPDEQCAILKCLLKCIETFGPVQIRNVATIGGSLSKNRNYSDLQTFCKGFSVVISYMKLSEQTDTINQKIIEHISIPLTLQKEKAWFEKIGRRKDCSSAVLNVAVKHVQNDHVSVTFGGESVQRFQILILDIDNAEQLIEKQVQENFVPGDFHSLIYIQKLAKNIIKKISLWLKGEIVSTFTSSLKSTQLFQQVETETLSSSDLLHRAVPHASAYKHTTGEAKFCDDTTKFHNELELAFVLSTRAHAKIVKVDYTQALSLEGVVGYVSKDDLSSENNKWGLVEKDEEIFASEKVTCVGQIIGGILAGDRLTAKCATKLVKITYEDISPMILTNEDAILHKSYYEKHGMTLSRGDCSVAFENSPNILSSELKIGSQEHFYMEPQSCIAIPKGEDGEMEIISSTQNPTGVQMEVAKCLAIPANRVVVKVKRVGGGFGGKEIRCIMIALPTAIAANKFGKPVRCILDRTTDFTITGKRHFYLVQQKIGFDQEGKLEAFSMSVYANAGNSLEVSMAPIERILLNVDNTYNIPNINWQGFVCKTNIPSNSVMRGTGGPQAVFIMENIMDTIASSLGKDPAHIKQLQMYTKGDQTPYGQIWPDCNIRKCWDACIEQSKYFETRLEIDRFNSENQFTKRGISINPCQYGVGFTALHLNQGTALVNIYTDGSVVISHGGVEIGQGVHSKMIQIATRELGVRASNIRILETATDKVPNTTPSSASVTSDLNGGAVIDACKQLVERLQPYWIQNPDDTFEQLVSRAYLDRVNLSAVGFYKTSDMGWDGKKGNPFNYFSTGAACSVVELDCLNGTYQILKTQVVMDCGQSLNPGIDIGQIEGAFVQGIGLFMLEEVIYNGTGELVTCDPSTYKIPTSSDIPLEFNVTLLPGSENPKAVHSSKTVGEPPLLLSPSVFFAVKDAIRSHRKSVGANIVFDMDSPASIRSILEKITV